MKSISLILFIFSIFIASVSQILLKKGSKEKNIIINRYTIIGYIIMVLSTLLTLIAYKNINLSLGGVLQSFSYIFVLLLSYIFLQEKISKKMILGIVIIVIGVIIYSL